VTNKNVRSSDAVKCGNPQIWSLNDKVFQTPNYLSHLMIFDACYADNTRNQGYRPIDLWTRTHV